MPDLSAVLVVSSGIAFACGVAIVARGIVRWKEGRVARSLAVVAPLSRQPCVYYRVRVFELRARTGLAARHHREWVPLIDERRGFEIVADSAIDLQVARGRDTTGARLSRDEAALLRRYGVSPLDGLGMPRRLRFEQVAIETATSRMG